MSLLHSDVLCPYCLEELRKPDVKHACPLCGGEVVQSKMDALLNKLPKCPEPSCHKTYASTRKCRFCDSVLPADIMDYEKYLRFSILGITGAGKTNFLTTMLHELRHSGVSPWVLAPMDSQTSLMYRENDEAVYERRTPVEATTAGTAPQPQQWKIRDKSRMTNKEIPTYSLTIFDGAGEDCMHIDPVISRFISGSKALVILIDPLALPSVARTIPENILNWSTTAKHGGDASAQMVDGLANYIRQSCNILPGKLIDRDVAVVFTKIDAVRESFGAAVVMQPSPHMARHGFVTADADAVDAEIRDWLIRNGETSFLDAVDTNFRKGRVRFFGVSSFGHPPTGSGRLGKVMPHRVLDPLMWMLSKEGMIQTV